jgi:hypothetical protein
MARLSGSKALVEIMTLAKLRLESIMAPDINLEEGVKHE